MKRGIIVVLVCLLLISAVLAEQNKTADDKGSTDDKGDDKGQNSSSDDKGSMNSTDDKGQADDKGQDVGSTKNAGEETEIQKKAQVQEQIGNLKQEMEQVRTQMQTKNQKQNEVKVAAQTLSKMASMLGGIGDQVSDIAKGFDNSVEKTIAAEDKIDKKGGLARFLTGGDKDAAETLETEAQQNLQKITELKQLQEQCDCDEEVKAMMQEQIQQMEQEQARLTELAAKEKKSKGILGWLWK